jgi:O-antigen ligase
MRLSDVLGETDHLTDRLAYGAFLVCAFGAGASLPLGRAGLALCLIVVLVGLARRVYALRATATFWLALAFVLLTVLVTCNGLNPELGVPKLDKLLWFFGLFVGPFVLTRERRPLRVLQVYVVGCVITAIRTLIERPLAARETLASGDTDDLAWALAHGASMTDAQRLMLGMLAAIGLVFITSRIKGKARWYWGLALLVQSLGLVMTFKRGAWICNVFAASLLLAALTRWRYVVIPAVIAGALLFLPFVQQRLGDLRSEFNVDGGGRLTMWCKVTPGLIKDHPFGIGYRSLTNDLMREYAPNVEPNRDHLHSNFAQILVASGWLGLVLYMLWMLSALRDGMVHAVRSVRNNGPPASIVATTLVAMLAALMCNGLVEYNFGDAELVLAYGVIMGACIAGRLQTDP